MDSFSDHIQDFLEKELSAWRLGWDVWSGGQVDDAVAMLDQAILPVNTRHRFTYTYEPLMGRDDDSNRYFTVARRAEKSRLGGGINYSSMSNLMVNGMNTWEAPMVAEGEFGADFRADSCGPDSVLFQKDVASVCTAPSDYTR